MMLGNVEEGVRKLRWVASVSRIDPQVEKMLETSTCWQDAGGPCCTGPSVVYSVHIVRSELV